MKILYLTPRNHISITIRTFIDSMVDSQEDQTTLLIG